MNPKSHLSANTAPTTRSKMFFVGEPEPLKPSDYVEIKTLKELSLKQREQYVAYAESSNWNLFADIEKSIGVNVK
jgi:hypothetical protein